MKSEFEQIAQAIKTAWDALDSTIPVCQALADNMDEGFVCTGCPALQGSKRCSVYELRRRMRELFPEILS